MTKDHEFLRGLIDITKKLIDEQGDAHFTEIADGYFCCAISGEVYQAVRSRLLSIRRGLYLQFKLTVIPVTAYYYLLEGLDTATSIPRPSGRRSLSDIATNMKCAIDCLPFRAGKTSHGLYRPSALGDPLEKLLLEWSVRVTHGNARFTKEHLDTAHGEHRIAESDIRLLLSQSIPQDIQTKLLSEATAP